MLDGRSTLEFACVLFARGVPFVFATGHSDIADLVAGLPGVPVVGKPFSSDTLIGAIGQALRAGRR
jgi:FixJ family two-component response regulator